MMASETVTVLVATLAFLGLIAVPLVNGWVAARNRSEDWARQDAVAAQAAQAARLLQERQDIAETRAAQVADQAAEAATLLLAANERVAASAAAAVEHGIILEAKVDQIHSLVNSTLTSSLDSQAQTLEQLLGFMDADLTRSEKGGAKPDSHAVVRRAATVAQLEDLRVVLSDRKAATEVAAEELRQAKEIVEGPSRTPAPKRSRKRRQNG